MLRDRDVEVKIITATFRGRYVEVISIMALLIKVLGHEHNDHCLGTEMKYPDSKCILRKVESEICE